MMTMTRTLVIMLALAALITTAAAQPLPLQKQGQCPSGYRESGNYCAPASSRAPVAIPKERGQCPSGFMQSGNYCIEMKRRWKVGQYVGSRNVSGHHGVHPAPARTSSPYWRGAYSLLPLGKKIKAAEEALKRADVALAQKLGFKLCDCTFPPQIMLWHEKEKVTKCPRTECGHTIQDFNRPLPRSSGGWMSAWAPSGHEAEDADTTHEKGHAQPYVEKQRW
jgi:hypothetical protein